MNWLSHRAGIGTHLWARLRLARGLETYPDFEPEARQIIDKVRPYTMTSPERVYALIQAVKHIVEGRIEGDIVECGVWRGGSMRTAALTLVADHQRHRGVTASATFGG